MNQPSVAICIGAQKAGTTWLFRCLQEHPGISATPEKEIHFFSTHYTNTVDTFLEHFDTKKEGILFEASTSYLSCEKTPQRIAHMFPNAKIIVILRDPIERTFSHFLHYVSKNKCCSDMPIVDAVQQFPEFIHNSLYGIHLERYYKTFPANQILIIQYNDIKKAPQKVMDTVCTFLEIDTFIPTALFAQYHSARARAHPLYFHVTRLYTRAIQYSLGRFVIRLLRRIGINNLLIDTILRKTTRHKRTISQNQRVQLEKYFTEDQKKLCLLLTRYQ